MVITKKEFIKATEGTGGIITSIAKKLGKSRVAVYDFINKPHNTWTQIHLNQEREKFIDMAEGALMSKVKDKDMKAVKFTLSTIGKKRGYVPTQEVKHSGNISTHLSDSEKQDLMEDLEKEE